LYQPSFCRDYPFIKLKKQVIAFEHSSSTPQVAKANSIENKATIIVSF